MPCRATQDRQDIVKRFDKTWFTGEGNDNTFKYSCLENSIDRMKRQKDIPEDEPPRLEGVQYNTREERKC